jgi:addiction module HigA family antidote
MVRIPIKRVPTHSGEMLLEEFLVPASLTQRQLANSIHVPYQRVNDIVKGRCGITPSTALRLAKFFGNSPEFWMNIQLRWDLYHARNDELKILTTIEPYQSVTM